MFRLTDFRLSSGSEIAQGFYAPRTTLPVLREQEDSGLTPLMRDLGRLLLDMWNRTEATIEEMNDRLKHLVRNSDLCRRLQTIPGVGVLLSTAIVSAVGDASTFSRARDLAAWVGLVPRQHTTGGKPRLPGIKTWKLLSAPPVRARRSRTLRLDRQPSGRSAPALAGPLAERRHVHVAICALANKLVRIAWAVLRTDTEFQLRYRG